MDRPYLLRRAAEEGGRRTPAKRKLLRRAEARARAAGLQPVKACF